MFQAKLMSCNYLARQSCGVVKPESHAALLLLDQRHQPLFKTRLLFGARSPQITTRNKLKLGINHTMRELIRGR